VHDSLRNFRTATCRLRLGHQQNQKPLEGADRPGASWRSGSSPGPVTRVVQRFPGFAPAPSPAAHSRLREVHCACAPARPPSRLLAFQLPWRAPSLRAHLRARACPSRSRPPTPPTPTARSLPARSLLLSAAAHTVTAHPFAHAHARMRCSCPSPPPTAHSLAAYARLRIVQASSPASTHRRTRDDAG
jgi:hypothetical protein